MRSPLEYIACRYFLLWSLSCTSSKCVSVLIRIRYCNARVVQLIVHAFLHVLLRDCKALYVLRVFMFRREQSQYD